MFVEEKAQGEKPFSQVMNEAADLIEKRGQAVGNLYNQLVPEPQPLCMWAAVHEVVTGERANFGGIRAISYHQRLERWVQGVHSTNICDYNNTHSKEEAVATLRKAAIVA